MKKVLIILLCVLAALLFVSCSWFDSAPVEPKILGITHIVQERGLMYAAIDTMRYPVDQVFTGEVHPHVGDDVIISPVDGMQVTVVQANGDNHSYQGVMFMLGEWNEAQIEKAFHRNYTFAVLAPVILLICVICLGISCLVEDERQRQRNPIA